MKATQVCVVPECGRPRSSRGYCRMHYSRWQRHGDPLKVRTIALGRPCAVESCDVPVGTKSARGYCARHYQRLLATGSPTGSLAPSTAERFFGKVRPAGPFDCWLWTASGDECGYGLFKGDRMIRAHIWSYEYFVTAVPVGLQMDHLCHDKTCVLGVDCPHRRCVNPWHLEPVLPAMNTDRGRAAKRTHCPQGHAYTLDNTYINPRGAQVCRTCTAVYRQRYEAKKKRAA